MSKIIFLLSCFFICAISAEKTSEDDCQNLETHGSDYTGTVNQTASGIPCQKWSSQEPHEHEHGDVGDHNYCRNPDGGDGVWCYTTDNETRWQLCHVPFCGNTTTSTTTEATTNSSQTPVVTTPTPATISSTTTDSNTTTPTTTTTTSNITTPTTTIASNTTTPTTPVTSNTTISTTTTSTTPSTSTISTTNSSSTSTTTTSTTTTSTTTTSITTTSTTTASTTTSTISTSTATASTTTSTITTSTATASTTTSTISTSTATASTTTSTTTTTQNPVSPARSSSVLPADGHTGDPDVDSFGPQFAIDGQISTTDHAFFHSALEDYPWLEIKLSSPTEISAVQIVNRRDCCGQRLHKAEIRAGDVSVPDGTQSKPLDINNVCGKYEGPGETGLDPVIKCKNTILANYVTVQLMAHQSWLQVNELIVQ